MSYHHWNQYDKMYVYLLTVVAKYLATTVGTLVASRLVIATLFHAADSCVRGFSAFFNYVSQDYYHFRHFVTCSGDQPRTWAWLMGVGEFCVPAPLWLRAARYLSATSYLGAPRILLLCILLTIGALAARLVVRAISAHRRYRDLSDWALVNEASKMGDTRSSVPDGTLQYDIAAHLFDRAQETSEYLQKVLDGEDEENAKGTLSPVGYQSFVAGLRKTMHANLAWRGEELENPIRVSEGVQRDWHQFRVAHAGDVVNRKTLVFDYVLYARARESWLTIAGTNEHRLKIATRTLSSMSTDLARKFRDMGCRVSAAQRGYAIDRCVGWLLQVPLATAHLLVQAYDSGLNKALQSFENEPWYIKVCFWHTWNLCARMEEDLRMARLFHSD